MKNKKKVKIRGFRLDVDLEEALSKLYDRYHVKPSTMIRTALKEYLAKFQESPQEKDGGQL